MKRFDTIAAAAIGAIALISATASRAMCATPLSPAAHRVGGVDMRATKLFTVNLRQGTTLSDVRLVAAYLRRFGLAVDDRNRHVLFVGGTYGQAAAAASTGFEEREIVGTRFTHMSHPATFPPQIARRVLATTLDDGPPMERSGVTPDFTLLPQYGFTPAGLATFYDAAPLYSAGTNGAGENVAIIECGQPNPSSVPYFQSQFGLPANSPNIEFVDTSIAPYEIEPTVDAEQLYSTAPNASLTMYVMTTPFNHGCTFSQFADTYAAILNDMPTKHYVAVGNQWTASEDYYDASGMDNVLTAEHADIANLVSAGATVFAASGFSGAGPPPQEALSAGEFTVEYPASDPGVVGVGGTSPIPKGGSNSTRSFEIAVGSSGGGVSHEFTIPRYQKGLKGIASKTMRNVPDVAYDGDPNLCAEYFYLYPGQRFETKVCLGGTFMGGDSWTGFMALVDQARAKMSKGPLVNVQADVYAAAPNGSLLRISQGCNDYYCADGNIYSNVTGVGVPDVAKLVGYLANLP